MQDIETALKSIIKSMQKENQQKVSQSFCEGGESHSMLLSHPSTTPVVIQNVRNKYIINNNNHSSMFPNGGGGGDHMSQAGDSSGPNN
jgi:hypothetical protein